MPINEVFFRLFVFRILLICCTVRSDCLVYLLVDGISLFECIIFSILVLTMEAANISMVFFAVHCCVLEQISCHAYKVNFLFRYNRVHDAFWLVLICWFRSPNLLHLYMFVMYVACTGIVPVIHIVSLFQWVISSTVGRVICIKHICG